MAHKLLYRRRVYKHLNIKHKANKSRVTILVDCSMDGKKMPLLCIGTAAKPRWPTVQGKRAAAPLNYLKGLDEHSTIFNYPKGVQ